MPRWVWMWLIAAAILAVFKVITWVRARASSPWWRQLGYLFAWPGMDAPQFLAGSVPLAERPRLGEWAFAALKLLLGIALLWALAPRLAPASGLAGGWVGMTGMVFVLHFGSFHLASCAWRAAGVPARPLMDWPVRSVSMAEFWGRRWNRAFRDLTHRLLYRPLARRWGTRAALWISFLASGLVHELVISVPAGAGYGGPMAFFALQAAALEVERSPHGRRLRLGAGWRGWLFTVAVVLGPAVALVHPPFVRRVILPFLEALHAR